MTAQAQAATVQHLPAFHCYTGEDDQTDDEVFDRWSELWGLEFHTKVQGDESIEQLGIDIQKLGHKAFPTMKGKALHVKWQRKLEAPRPTESFSELYDHAWMLERHEKQYAASAATRGDTRNTGKMIGNNNRNSKVCLATWANQGHKQLEDRTSQSQLLSNPLSLSVCRSVYSMESVTAVNSMDTWRETVLVRRQAEVLMKPMDIPLLKLPPVHLLLNRIPNLKN